MTLMLPRTHSRMLRAIAARKLVDMDTDTFADLRHHGLAVSTTFGSALITAAGIEWLDGIKRIKRDNAAFIRSEAARIAAERSTELPDVLHMCMNCGDVHNAPISCCGVPEQPIRRGA